MLTRRNALMAGGSALLVAGCGGRPARKLAGSSADLPFLTAALELERGQIAMYEAMLRALGGRAPRIARQILAYERAHADAVAEAIRELGGRVPAPKPRPSYEEGLPRGRARGSWVRAAAQREQAAAAAYAAAIPKLANGRLKSTFGSIMASEAEHGAALEVPA